LAAFFSAYCCVLKCAAKTEGDVMLTIKKLIVAFCLLTMAIGTLRIFERALTAEQSAFHQAAAEVAAESLWRELQTTKLPVLQAKAVMSQEEPLVLNDQFQAMIFINEPEPYKLDISVEVYWRHTKKTSENKRVHPIFVRSGLVR
jgi:hypothetical protein